MIDYHVLGIGGAAISVSFVNCISSTSIELKFSQLLTDANIQLCGVSPMRRNLIRALQRRGKSSRMGLLKCMLDELSGDHAQSLQLAMTAQQLLTEDDGVKKAATEVYATMIMSMVVANTNIAAQVAKKALSYT